MEPKYGIQKGIVLYLSDWMTPAKIETVEEVLSRFLTMTGETFTKKRSGTLDAYPGKSCPSGRPYAAGPAPGQQLRHRVVFSKMRPQHPVSQPAPGSEWGTPLPPVPSSRGRSRHPPSNGKRKPDRPHPGRGGPGGAAKGGAAGAPAYSEQVVPAHSGSAGQAHIF